MPDFYCKIKTKLFQDGKHYQKMGEAIWLYGYIHSFALGSGQQCATIYLNIFCKKCEIDLSLAEEWLNRLAKHGYIVVKKRENYKIFVCINKPISVVISTGF